MITVAIPTSTMKNGDALFFRCVESLWNQTFQDFEIVVTDNSEDDAILNICRFFKTGITYYRNPIKGMAANTNEAIRRSRGELIKILYMDDFLAHRNALKKIVNSFEGDWLVTACTHIREGNSYTENIHYPAYSQDIHTGNNTIGSPSVLTIRNKDPILFDEKLGWLLDCDYYRRMYDKYGEPICLRDINVIIGIHDGQETNVLGEQRKLAEYEYLQEKYA